MISVIIPAYNSAQTINKTLDSVFRQTEKDLEVIIVDDGSTDNLQQALLPRTERITVYSQENKGAPAARNYGFRQSHGELVIFLDADIIMKPKMLTELKQALKDHPLAVFAYSQFLWGWKKFTLWPFDFDRLRKMPYIHTSALIKREKFPGFDESLKKFQDWDLFLTIAEKGGVGAFVPKVLFRVASSGTMSSWLPSIAYRLPWFKSAAKGKYEQAMAIIRQKHNL